MVLCGVVWGGGMGCVGVWVFVVFVVGVFWCGGVLFCVVLLWVWVVVWCGVFGLVLCGVVLLCCGVVWCGVVHGSGRVTIYFWTCYDFYFWRQKNHNTSAGRRRRERKIITRPLGAGAAKKS